MTGDLTHRANRSFYHGLLLDEVSGSDVPAIDVDVAFYVASWEGRCTEFTKLGSVNARINVVLEFSDEGMTERPQEVLGASGKTVELIRLGSHYDIRAAVARVVDVFKDLADRNLINSIFLDISSMPKLMIQWLFLEIVHSQLSVQVWLGYVAGHYADGGLGPQYDQGVADLVTVPHSVGDAGASVRKACIAALGADDRLVSYYFENEAGFDRHFLLSSTSADNPAIADRVKQQIGGLSLRYGLDSADVVNVAPYSFLPALEAYETFMRHAPACDSWEIFCTGPKPHAVAACLLATKHRNVRLVGRIPTNYDRSNVGAGSVVSVLRVLDLTNPRISSLPSLRIFS
jgi:hypothetical protein